MAGSKDILVGYEVKANANPKKITQSFDGENEGISQQPLVDAFKALKTDLQKHYTKFAAETAVIEIKKKTFT